MSGPARRFPSDVPREIIVLLFITVQARGTDDNLAAALVQRIALDALRDDGWAPVSSGFGVRPHPER